MVVSKPKLPVQNQPVGFKQAGSKIQKTIFEPIIRLDDNRLTSISDASLPKLLKTPVHADKRKHN